MGRLAGLGLFGLFLGTFLAATVAPFSSDVLYVGILMTGINPWAVFAVGTLGNWTGGITTYLIGWLGRWEWIEKWFKVKPETLEKQKKSIDKWGPPLALVSWMPIIGDAIVLAMGFYKSEPVRTCIYMLVGKALRFIAWTLLFFKYGEAVLNHLF